MGSEMCIRDRTESDPAVWVRTYQDDDADRMVRRREVRQIIADHLAAHPEHMITFAQGSGVMGDVVATVMFPEELLCELVVQFGYS